MATRTLIDAIVTEAERDVHAEYIVRMVGAQDYEALRAVDKEHYNKWFIPALKKPMRGAHQNLIEERKRELRALREEFEYKATERKEELLPAHLDETAQRLANLQAGMRDKIGAMLPALEGLYDAMVEFCDEQEQLFERQRELRHYNGGNMPHAEYKLPWGVVKGLEGAPPIERNAVMLRLLVAKYTRAKHPAMPLSLTELILDDGKAIRNMGDQ